MSSLQVLMLTGLLAQATLAHHRHLLATETLRDASQPLPDSIQIPIEYPWGNRSPAMEEIMPSLAQPQVATQQQPPRVTSAVGPSTGATQLQPDDAVPVLTFPGSTIPGNTAPSSGINPGSAAAAAGAVGRAQLPQAPPAKIGKLT